MKYKKEVKFIGSLKIQKIDKDRYYVIDFNNKLVTGYYSGEAVKWLLATERF